MSSQGEQGGREEEPEQERVAEWSRYWHEEGAAGEVLLNRDGEPHPLLSDFWRAQLQDLPASARVLDLASGAGSVLVHLPPSARAGAVALDSSQKALQRLQKRLPQVSPVVASMPRLPFPPKSFDLLVSQFGVEYAGLAATAEMSDWVADQGRLVFLCHHTGSPLYAQHEAQLRAAREARQSEFIDAALGLMRAIFASDAVAQELALSQFSRAEARLRQQLHETGGGVHRHLYDGFAELYRNHARYAQEDIIGWLDAMRGELERSILRLSAICEAALDEAKFGRLQEELRQGRVQDEVQARIKARAPEARRRSFEILQAGPLLPTGAARPLAWRILARPRDI